MSDQLGLDAFLGNLTQSLKKATLDSAEELSRELSNKMDSSTSYFARPAPNAIEWCVSQEYLNLESIYHHVRQYQIIRDFFQLRCPLPTCNDQDEQSRDCWGKTRSYLESENLLVWSDEYCEDVCPKCKSTRSELTADGLLVRYNQLHLICGMRSGKSSLASIMGTYVEHRIINVGHSYPGGLSAYFKQMPRQPFEIAFTASTEVQAADTIWAKFVSLRGESPWFQEYIKWIKKLELDQNTINGAKPWTYEERDKYIVNGYLNVKINSMNSNSSGMAGRTRIASFIDELSRFDSRDSPRSADEAYRVLENSLRTVRSAVYNSKELPWLGCMISISSPISEDDKGMRLLRDAPKIKGMYYGHYATWDFNPDQPRSMFDDDFEKDPIGAMRDFGAQPPTSASPLISDPNRFKEMAIDNTLSPTATFSKVIHVDRLGIEYVSAVVESAKLLRDADRYIAFDAGVSFDQFSAACVHGEWVESQDGKQLVTVYDWVLRLVPEVRPRRDIWFEFVIAMLERLRKYVIISRVNFDRWQSTYLIQQIRDRGIMATVKGTTVDMYSKFLNDVNYGKVRMLPPLPSDEGREPTEMSAQALAFYELVRLERSADLKKVWNPRKGKRRGYDSDDVAQVVVHANHMLQSTISDTNMSNSPESRLKREVLGGSRWDGGPRLFRPPVSRRGW